MEITPEWAIVVLTLMGMSARAGMWVQKRRDTTRRALPIIRAHWTTGTDGHTAHLHIINRLDEDLHIHRAEADGGFAVNVGTYDPATGTVPAVWEERPSPMELDWMIAPNSESRFSLSVRESRRTIIKMSSSAKTLRCKRITIRDSHKM